MHKRLVFLGSCAQDDKVGESARYVARKFWLNACFCVEILLKFV